MSRRFRIAFFTPLNPMHTGISDYSEELLPHLGDLADVDIVIADYEPSTPSIRKRFRILHAQEFLRSRTEYDCVIYQIGNSLQYHEYMVECMRQAPGIVVLHDYSLSYLILGLTVLRGDYGALRRIADRYYRAAPALASRLLFSRVDPYTTSLAGPIVAMSRGIVVHSRFAFDWLMREFPGARARHIPHGVEIGPVPEPDPAVRARYGITPDALVIASVSTLAYNKRIPTVLNCLPRLKNEFPGLKLLLVSGGRLGAESRRAIEKLGLKDTVISTGWVPWDEYRRLIRAADVVVNLRYPTAGETSGSALRSLEAGRPLIVSDHGSFGELPDEVCLRVPVNRLPGDTEEEEGFLAAARMLLGDPGRRSRMGAAARDYVCRELGLDLAAARYLEFARQVAAFPAPISASEEFTSGAAHRATRLFYSLLYRTFRLRYVYRNYGLADIRARLTRKSV